MYLFFNLHFFIENSPLNRFLLIDYHHLNSHFWEQAPVRNIPRSSPAYPKRLFDFYFEIHQVYHLLTWFFWFCYLFHSLFLYFLRDLINQSFSPNILVCTFQFQAFRFFDRFFTIRQNMSKIIFLFNFCLRIIMSKTLRTIHYLVTFIDLFFSLN